MTEEERRSFYRESAYKNLRDALDKKNKEEAITWFEQLQMGYGNRGVETEIGTLESLLKNRGIV